MSKDKSVRTEKLKNVLKEKTKSLLGPVLILSLDCDRNIDYRILERRRNP